MHLRRLRLVPLSPSYLRSQLLPHRSEDVPDNPASTYCCISVAVHLAFSFQCLSTLRLLPADAASWNLATYYVDSVTVYRVAVLRMLPCCLKLVNLLCSLPLPVGLTR